MKNPLYVATIVAAVLAGMTTSAHAQAAGPGVAIIDLSYVFKNYGKFTDMTANMKRTVERAETELRAKRDELQKLADRVNGLPLGSVDRNKLEAELTRRQADMQVQVTEQKKDFLRQEARIYYTIYQEVLDEIKYYAERNGVSLVLRFNGDPIDPNNPQEVLQDLNKSVIFHHKQIDITPLILGELDRRWRGGADAARRTTPATQGVRPR